MWTWGQPNYSREKGAKELDDIIGISQLLGARAQATLHPPQIYAYGGNNW